MNFRRRSFIRNSAGLLVCSCLSPSSTLAQSADVVDELSVPAADFGCSTLDTFADELEVVNYSSAQKDLVDKLQFTDYGTFVFSKRWRQSDGLTPNSGVITLGCHFLNGNESQQKAIQEAAQGWPSGDLANLISFRFGVPVESSHIRINLGGKRNNSYVGRDNLRIKQPNPTMNLANFDNASTVRHEFGHALGLRHEHRFPGAIQFNEEVVVSDMKRQHGWTTAQTYRNILTPLGSTAKCIGDPELNDDSIMMYTIPKHWTVDGASYQRIGTITERDRLCLIGVYSA